MENLEVDTFVIGRTTRTCPKEHQTTSQEIVYVKQVSNPAVLILSIFFRARNVDNFFVYRCTSCKICWPIGILDRYRIKMKYKWSYISGSFPEWEEKSKHERIMLAD